MRLAVIFLIVAALVCQGAGTAETGHDRRAAIARVRADYERAGNDSDRYAVGRRLFSLYRTYRCDSAMIVAGQRLAQARRLGDPGKIISASLNVAEGYMAGGDYAAARAAIDTLPRALMQPYHLRTLYRMYVTALDRMAERELVPARRIELQDRKARYIDSALSCFSPDDITYYTLTAQRLEARGLDAEALAMMRDGAKHGGGGAHEAAYMAELFRRTGQSDSAIAYLSRAVEADRRDEVRTHDYLMRLAILLNEEGRQEEAFRYLQAALAQASEADARDVERRVLEAAPLITAALHEHDKAGMERQRMWLALTALLALTLGAGLWGVWAHLRRNRRMTARLNEANSRLAAQNSALEQAGAERQLYISQLFDVYSETLGRQKGLKKQFGRMLKAAQYDRALALARDNQTEQEALHELYGRFDTIFLRLYPRFVEKYNSAVTPEARLAPDADALTPETRVLALILLGFTDSGHIARVLHYSPQTVYNYRSRLRTVLTADVAELERSLAEK